MLYFVHHCIVSPDHCLSFDCCIVCPDHCLSFRLLYRLSWSLFVILTVATSVLISVCHFDCCIVCPDHCLSFWLLYCLSWSVFVILTVVSAVLWLTCYDYPFLVFVNLYGMTCVYSNHNFTCAQCTCLYILLFTSISETKPYFGYLIASVVYCLAWSPHVRWILGSSPHRVKRTSLKLVCVASPLNTQH